MKRCLIPIVTVLILISGLTGGCSQEFEQIEETSSKDTLTPIVIEKDVAIKWEGFAGERLGFNLKAGDRVEGEVSLNEDAMVPTVFDAVRRSLNGRVKDPYGNTILQRDNMPSPWRFAFIAVSDGEYMVKVSSDGQIMELSPSAHIKITSYKGD